MLPEASDRNTRQWYPEATQTGSSTECSSLVRLKSLVAKDNAPACEMDGYTNVLPYSGLIYQDLFGYSSSS